MLECEECDNAKWTKLKVNKARDRKIEVGLMMVYLIMSTGLKERGAYC